MSGGLFVNALLRETEHQVTSEEAARLEQTLGHVGGSPFAEAMKSGMPAADELAAEVIRSYKGLLG